MGAGRSAICRAHGWIRGASGLLALALASVAGTASAQAALGDELVSRSDGGTRGNGASNEPVISGNGRYVAFTSGASNLVAGDSNGTSDVFVFDRVAHTLRRASTDANGVQANGASGDPAITPDGRYVAFASTASNLVSGDNDGLRDVFVKDMQSGAIQRASASTHFATTELCGDPDVSDDGTVVAYRCTFPSSMTGLVRRVLGSGASTTIITDSSFGSLSAPRLSGDGRSVAFVTDKNGVVGNDSNNQADVFVYLHDNGSTRLVSNVPPNGAPLGAVFEPPAIRFDGCEIAFSSNSPFFVTGDLAGEQDVFVRDLCAQRVERVSVDSDEFEAQGPSARPAISADGRYVAFHTNDTGLQSLDNPVSGNFLVVRDRRAPGNTSDLRTAVVSGLTFDFFAIAPSISDDGREVAAQASGNVPSDQIVAVGNALVFAQPVTPVNDPNGGEIFAPVPSSDGSLVLVSSDAAGFNQGWSGNDADAGAADTYVFRPPAPGKPACMEQISMSSGDFNSPCFNGPVIRAKRIKGNSGPSVPCGTAPADQVTEICAPTMEPTLAAGRMLAAFVVDDAAVNFVANQTKAETRARKQAGSHGVYLRNLISGALFRVGNAVPGGAGTNPQLAPDGQSIVFVTTTPLTGDDGNAGADAYRIGIKPDPADGFDPPRCLSCKNADGSSNPPGAGQPVLSANGTIVAMTIPTAAGGSQVFLRNLLTGVDQRIGSPTGQAQTPRVDFSGTQLVFGSNENLDGSDANGKPDIYHYESCCNKLTRVTRPASGDADEESIEPAISGDGRSVSFISRAGNLDPSDPAGNGHQHLFVQRLVGARERLRLARNSQGQLADDDSFRPALDYNGTATFYDSLAANLKDGEDFNPGRDVFQRRNPLNADVVFGTGFE
jgi:Tol biopolymer transport system component